MVNYCLKISIIFKSKYTNLVLCYIESKYVSFYYDKSKYISFYYTFVYQRLFIP